MYMCTVVYHSLEKIVEGYVLLLCTTRRKEPTLLCSPNPAPVRLATLLAPEPGAPPPPSYTTAVPVIAYYYAAMYHNHFLGKGGELSATDHDITLLLLTLTLLGPQSRFGDKLLRM